MVSDCCCCARASSFNCNVSYSRAWAAETGIASFSATSPFLRGVAESYCLRSTSLSESLSSSSDSSSSSYSDSSSSSYSLDRGVELSSSSLALAANFDYCLLSLSEATFFTDWLCWLRRAYSNCDFSELSSPYLLSSCDMKTSGSDSIAIVIPLPPGYSSDNLALSSSCLKWLSLILSLLIDIELLTVVRLGGPRESKLL